MKRKVTVADLFCGAGGTSTGLRKACEALDLNLQLLAVNHWDIAIQTHSTNHPDAEHLCSTLDSVDPRKVVPSGRLDLLIASPECTHHSIARGGKPINDQSRASAWRIVEWCSQIHVDHVLIENVKEFQTWGPLGTTGRPLKRQKGATYFAFLNALESLGYTVEARVLNAADYGDATSRERLFIQARKGRKRIHWPEPTHGASSKSVRGGGLFDGPSRPPHRPAKEIIDWSIPGESIFRRKRPLAPTTMQRIAKGLEKFCGLPFLVKYYGGADAHSIDKPLPTVTANYEHYGVCQPFIVELRNNKNASSIDKPLSVITTAGAHHALCQPFIIPLNHGKGDFRGYHVDRPMPTITSVDAWALINPFLIKYNGTGGSMSVDDPLDTVTAKDRFGLVAAKKEGAYLDVLFRMLQPHELSAAMSFPRDYVFHGNREQRVRQIGNAVPVNLAQNLCRSILEAK